MLCIRTVRIVPTIIEGRKYTTVYRTESNVCDILLHKRMEQLSSMYNLLCMSW
ncbi:MAG: hypothetical protein LBU60_03540 [Clostridiales bacterium]|nr:hypothetical protein [Clostridiales bacterium]